MDLVRISRTRKHRVTLVRDQIPDVSLENDYCMIRLGADDHIIDMRIHKDQMTWLVGRLQWAETILLNR